MQPPGADADERDSIAERSDQGYRAVVQLHVGPAWQLQTNQGVIVSLELLVHTIVAYPNKCCTKTDARAELVS